MQVIPIEEQSDNAPSRRVNDILSDLTAKGEID